MSKVAGWVRNARLATWRLTRDDLYWPDPEVEAEIVRRAGVYGRGGVNAVVLFGLHFRWDFVPYFERIVLLVRRIVEACSKYEIRVCDHYSDTLIHRPRDEADRRFIRERCHHHVAIYPDADEDYRYAGTWRNSWRMLDVRTLAPVYFEPYRCNLFCPNNPDFQRASVSYALKQFDEAGIAGLMNDDLHFLPDYHTCACEHCQARFRAECNRELPPADDTEFWGNRANPAFRDWLRMRRRSMGDHYARLRLAIGPERPLFGCCCETMAPIVADRGMVYDEFSRGCNVASMEMMGDDLRGNWRAVFPGQSLFQAIAAIGPRLRQEPAPAAPDPFVALAYATNGGQFRAAWALQKAWGARSWVCPSMRAWNAGVQVDAEEHLPATLGWERDHPELFAAGERVADVAVLFSAATRNFAPHEEARQHRTAFVLWLDLLAEQGLLARAVFSAALAGRADGAALARQVKVVVMPAATALGDAATQALRAFGAAGGRVLVCGPGVTRDADGLPRQQPAALDAARLDLAPLLETAAADDGTEGGRERRARAVASCLDPLRALLPAPTMEMLGRPLPWLAFLYRHPGYYVLHVVNVGPAAVDDCAEDGAHAAGVLSLQLRLPERLDTAIRFAPRGRSEGRTLSPTRTADGCRLDLELDRTAPYLLVQLPVPKP